MRTFTNILSVCLIIILTGLFFRYPGASESKHDRNSDMIQIPGGEFKMGYANGHSDEQPVHTVQLDSF